MTNHEGKHPAPYSENVISTFGEIVRAELRRLGHPIQLLDPFAGVGRIHHIGDGLIRTTGVELEPEWALAHPDTIVGDATNLPEEWTAKFDVLATSPCYGNRFADTYDGRDGSDRRTYRIWLGRMPSDGSAAILQWGEDYRTLHLAAWFECTRVLKPGGLFLLNVKNHPRDFEIQRVMEWHLRTLIDLGYYVEEIRHVDTPGYGKGANLHPKGEAKNLDRRIRGEKIMVLRAPLTPLQEPQAAA